MKFYNIQIKRVYNTVNTNDGHRVLVGRLWPRGIKKDTARIDLWLKDIAPSGELRKWYSHDSEKWKEFKSKYFKELDGKKNPVGTLIKSSKGQKITLIYSAKEEKFNNATALKEYIEKHYKKLYSQRRKVEK